MAMQNGYDEEESDIESKIMKLLKKVILAFMSIGALLFLLPILLFLLIYPFSNFSYDGFLKEHKSVYPIEDLDLSGAKNLRDVGSIEWINDDKLLIGGHGDAIVYDVNNQGIDLQYSSLPFVKKFYWTKCLSEHGAIFMFKRDEDQMHKEFLIEDFDTLSHYTVLDIPSSEWWNTNKLDCKTFKYRDHKKEPNINYRGKEISFVPENRLLLTDHGTTKTYKIDNRTLLVTDETNKNYPIEIKLPQGFTRQDSLHSSYDQSKNEYLWYVLQRRFAQDPQSDYAKIKAWRVTPDLELLQKYELPAGPWIYKDGYASCFSCGCACYDRVHLKLRNGQIFAHVYGQGVKWQHKGIYQLDEKLSEWIPIVTGDTGEDFAVSADGCKIAYSGEYAAIIDRCLKK